MEDKAAFKSICLKNFLSYGADGTALEIHPLNVLIGPNASGKSNFIEAFRFLRSLPSEPAKVIREGGGISEFLFKGTNKSPIGEIGVSLGNQDSRSLLQYKIAISEVQQRFQIHEEVIVLDEEPDQRQELYRYPWENAGQGQLVIYESADRRENRHNPFPQSPKKQIVSVFRDKSVISAVKDPVHYPYLHELDTLFSNVHCYSGWPVDRYSPIRTPQKADLPADVLAEDGSNLGLILNNSTSKFRQALVEKLNQVYGPIEEIRTQVLGGVIQIFIHEVGLSQPTPAIRCSEGMLRYLCLLTLLLNPTPPALICLEEPEIGLHPDVIPEIAGLLKLASKETKLIVTTHSTHLVSALSDAPEAIVVCDRDQSGTQLRRLEAGQLQEWLETYSLGDLWLKGELGGTRW